MERFEQKETIIYGGAFNPPTLAHVAILRACFEYASEHDADVWVLPSGDRLDKTIAVPRTKRLEYIDAMVEDARIGKQTALVQTTELDRQVSVETIDTVNELRANYTDRDFRFVFGADSTETMGQWKGGNELLENLSMLVVEREGNQINPLAQHVVRLTVQTPDVSSTQVRQRMQTGGSIQGLVSPLVAQLLSA